MPDVLQFIWRYTDVVGKGVTFWPTRYCCHRAGCEPWYGPTFSSASVWSEEWWPSWLR